MNIITVTTNTVSRGDSVSLSAEECPEGWLLKFLIHAASNTPYPQTLSAVFPMKTDL